MFESSVKINITKSLDCYIFRKGHRLKFLNYIVHEFLSLKNVYSHIDPNCENK